MEAPQLHAGVFYRANVAGDASALPPVARRIFTDTFGHLFDPLAFEAFCETAYGPGGSMVRDLADRAMAWRVAECADAPIGYAKLRPWLASAAGSPTGAMELQQIYVLADWHGKGVAETLMRWAIENARERGASELYLTVFDHNLRAKRFYARHGFVEVGRCEFRLGGQAYDDRVWCRSLA
jgi:GNAT superfamily N-acetyltransferase